MIEHRAYSVLTVKGMQDKPDGLTISGIASTPVTDRQGDIVEPMGAKFKTPMPLLWQHHADKPIGHVTFAKPNKDGIPFTAFLPNVVEPGLLKDRIDEAIHSIKYRLVGAISIGFKAVKGRVESIKGGFRFLEWDWLETSVVTIGANDQATIHTIKSLDQQQRAASGAERQYDYTHSVPIELSAGAMSPAEARRTTSPGATGKTLSTFSHKGTGMKTSVAEQIGNYEGERAYKMQQVDALLETADSDSRPLNETEQKQYDDLTNEVEQIDKHVDNLRRREKLLLTATPVTQEAGNDPDQASRVRQESGRPASVIFSKRNAFPGQAFARLVKAIAIGQGSRSDTEMYIRENFRDMPEIGKAYKELSMVQKAPVAAGTTTDADWAAPLVNYTDLASEFIELLRPQTILGRLTGVRRVPFNVRIPKLASGATSQWVGQGLPKPVSALDFDSVTMLFHKLSTIVVLTDELVRFSSPSAEIAVRDEVVGSVAQAMDATFIDPSVAAVSGVSPASITNGISAGGNPGTTVATITTALTAALSGVATANLNISSGVWIMRPQTAVYLSTVRTTQDILGFPGMGLSGGTLLGFPVIVSGNMPADTGSSSYIVFLVQNEIYVADDGQTRVDASREATLQMDSAPSSGAQSGVSMFQSNMVAIRAERFATWLRRRDTAVAVISDVSF